MHIQYIIHLFIKHDNIINTIIIFLFVCIVQPQLLGTAVSIWILTINIRTNFYFMGDTDQLVAMAFGCSWHVGVRL